MVLDCHIHIMRDEGVPDGFWAEMRQGGVSGGLIISLPPGSFRALAEARSTEERLDSVLRWTDARSGLSLFPFYWIDPLEDDAIEQVDLAVRRGISGFKVICNRFYPREEQPMRVFRAIAATGKPMLFHSGILYDGMDTSRYNRPAKFECLLDVPGLRFAMAHISWPWCDELIAVYGKFAAARGQRQDVPELFIDTTPGTPTIYRRDALTKIFTVGFDVKRNVLFGSDSSTHPYAGSYAADIVSSDRAIYADLGLDQETVDNVFANNLLRFIGESR